MASKPPSRTDESPAVSRLIIDCSYSAANASVAMYPPVIMIDGAEQRLAWGTSDLAVSPGPHQIEVSVGSVYGRVGKQAVTVDAQPGGCLRLEYNAPHVLNSSGSLHVATFDPKEQATQFVDYSSPVSKSSTNNTLKILAIAAGIAILGAVLAVVLIVVVILVIVLVN